MKKRSENILTIPQLKKVLTEKGLPKMILWLTKSLISYRTLSSASIFLLLLAFRLTRTRSITPDYSSPLSMSTRCVSSSVSSSSISFLFEIRGEQVWAFTFALVFFLMINHNPVEAIAIREYLLMRHENTLDLNEGFEIKKPKRLEVGTVFILLKMIIEGVVLWYILNKLKLLK